MYQANTGLEFVQIANEWLSTQYMPIIVNIAIGRPGNRSGVSSRVNSECIVSREQPKMVGYFSDNISAIHDGPVRRSGT
jgi:hypothetical protein